MSGRRRASQLLEDKENTVNLPAAAKKGTKRRASSTKATPQKKARRGSSKKTNKSKKSTQESVSEVEDLALFDVVMSKSTALVPTIDQWIKAYSSDSEAAVHQLVNFIVESCGCDKKIPLEQYREYDSVEQETHEQILQSLGAADVERDMGQYPIISRGKDLRRFRGNFLEFWKKLITQCQRDILYDNYLLETLFLWLIGFSKSPVRAFRHTSTLAGLQIQSSIISVTARLRNQLAVNQRQLEAEKSKKKDRSKTKIADLKKTCETLNERIAHTEEILLDVFKGLFGSRFRDVNAQIRSECVSFLGQWIKEYSVVFGKNTFLRMIGWAMSDRAPEVRMSAITALTELYKDDELATQMDAFSEYFLPRMVQLTSDKDIPVAVASFDLCAELARLELLSDDDLERVYGLVSDYDGRIRFRAAAFVNDYFLENVVATKAKSRFAALKKKKDETAFIITSQLLELLDMVEKYAFGFPDYLVDTLWGKSEILTSWSAMSDLLLNPGDKLTTTDGILLLSKFMTACIKRAAGEEIVPRTKSEPAHRDTPAVREQNLNNISIHFVPLLPKLINKFSENEEIISHLAQIPQYFLLDVYSKFELGDQFQELISELTDVFSRAVEKETSDAIARTLQNLRTRDHKFKTEADAGTVDVIEKLVAKIKRDSRILRETTSSSSSGSKSTLASSESEDVNNRSPTKISAALRFNLQRLTSLHEIEDVEQMGNVSNYYAELSKLLDRREFIEEVILEEVITAGFLCLLWGVSRIDPENTNRAEQVEVSQKAESYIGHLEYLLEKSETLGEKAYFMLSDTLILFNRTYSLYGTALRSIAYHPSDALVTKIKNYFHDQLTSLADTGSTQIHQGEEEDEEDQGQDRENLVVFKKRRIVAALGKLVVANALPHNMSEHVPDVLVHFVEHGKDMAATIKDFLSLVRDNITYDFEVVFSTLLKKWAAITADGVPDDPKLYDTLFFSLLGLANRLSATYGIYSARTDTMRLSLVNVVCKCIGWVAEDVEERKLFFKYATLPFINKLDAYASARILTDFNANFDDLELDEKEYADTVFAVKKALQHYAEKGGKTGIVRKAKAAATVPATSGAATTPAKGKSPPKKRKSRSTSRSTSKSKSKNQSKSKSLEKEQGEAEEEGEKEPEEEEEEEEPEASLRSRKRRKLSQEEEAPEPEKEESEKEEGEKEGDEESGPVEGEEEEEEEQPKGKGTKAKGASTKVLRTRAPKRKSEEGSDSESPSKKKKVTHASEEEEPRSEEIEGEEESESQRKSAKNTRIAQAQTRQVRKKGASSSEEEGEGEEEEEHSPLGQKMASKGSSSSEEPEATTRRGRRR